jgi:septal ring factor EnvC (AmiA/AmiB activator)
MAEEKKVDTASEQSTPAKRQRTSPKQRRQQSAMRYITILFAAAFVLMLFTYLMERRQNEVLMQENQEQIEDLQQSVSAWQSLQGLIEENEKLKVEIAGLETEISKLEASEKTLSGQLNTADQALDTAKKSLNAMDWFWQIDEAYVRGRYALCRSLIKSLDEAGLTESLPRVSITENDRFSPYDRLGEIRSIVF